MTDITTHAIYLPTQDGEYTVERNGKLVDVRVEELVFVDDEPVTVQQQDPFAEKFREGGTYLMTDKLKVTKEGNSFKSERKYTLSVKNENGTHETTVDIVETLSQLPRKDGDEQRVADLNKRDDRLKQGQAMEEWCLNQLHERNIIAIRPPEHNLLHGDNQRKDPDIHVLNPMKRLTKEPSLTLPMFISLDVKDWKGGKNIHERSRTVLDDIHHCPIEFLTSVIDDKPFCYYWKVGGDFSSLVIPTDTLPSWEQDYSQGSMCHFGYKPSYLNTTEWLEWLQGSYEWSLPFSVYKLRNDIEWLVEWGDYKKTLELLAEYSLLMSSELLHECFKHVDRKDIVKFLEHHSYKGNSLGVARLYENPKVCEFFRL